MAWLRLTLIEPAPGARKEALQVLSRLDEHLAGTPGLILSVITDSSGGRLARMSLWRSRKDANRVALREDVLALRAQLLRLATDTDETLMEVRSARVLPPLALLPGWRMAAAT